MENKGNFFTLVFGFFDKLPREITPKDYLEKKISKKLENRESYIDGLVRMYNNYKNLRG